MLPVAKREYQLSSGEVIFIGVNFRALEIMSRFPGGLNKLKKEMTSIATLDPDSDEYGEGIATALSAMSYMLYALILSGGTKCTQEDAMMAIGPEDFEQLNTIFEEFSEAMQKISPKNAVGRMMRT
jgi:hypothetical protein